MEKGKITKVGKGLKSDIIHWVCPKGHKQYLLKTHAGNRFTDHCWQCDKVYKLEIK